MVDWQYKEITRSVSRLVTIVSETTRALSVAVVTRASELRLGNIVFSVKLVSAVPTMNPFPANEPLTLCLLSQD